MNAHAQPLLRRLLEHAGGTASAGFVLVLDGEGLEELPAQIPTPHGVYTVHRAGTELGLRHVLHRARGAPFIAVVPEALAQRLPPDIVRRSKSQRIHALQVNDILEEVLGVKVTGAESPYLRELALENMGRLDAILAQRTMPTAVDRRLLTELLIEASLGGAFRERTPGQLLADWIRTPPAWSDNLVALVRDALPVMHGDEGRLLAWALDGRATRLRALVVHGALLTVEGEVSREVWGPLWGAAAEPPITMDRQILRWTLARLIEQTLDALGDAAIPLLTEAESLGRQRLTPTTLATSAVLPLAFHDRCHALATQAAAGRPIAPSDLDWIRRHRAAALGRAEIAVLEAMGRLSRYLAQPLVELTDVAEQARRYTQGGAFADLAATALRRALASAARYQAEAAKVLEAYRARRNRENLAFARALAAGYEAAIHKPELVPLHRLWRREVKDEPSAGLYLVVLDGCSYPVFLDLLAALASDGVSPIGLRPDADGRVHGGLGLAPLPTITSHARGAIFLGELPNDPLVAETTFREQDEAKTDKARFAQNPSLGGRRRALFLKGDLADHGQALLAALGDPSLEIVAAVFNAVDDQLGSSNTGAMLRIQPADIVAFRPSLEAALASGRRVLLTADHGHTPFVDKSLRRGAAGTPRFVSLDAHEAPPPGFLEIDVASLAGPPARRAFAYELGAYNGLPQVGFHGGAGLEEMIVPMAWLVRGGVAMDEPPWWYGATTIADDRPKPKLAELPLKTPVPSAPIRQPDLFRPETRVEALDLPAELVGRLDEGERAVLVLLREVGTARTGELAKRLNKSPMRVNGLMRTLTRKLSEAGVTLLSSEVLPSGEVLIKYQGGGRG